MTVVKMARAAIAIGAVVAGSATIAAQQAPTPAATPQQRRLVVVPATAPGEPLPSVQGFSVVLVLGDLQGGSTPDNVPPAAKKALADMKDFLPYKSYRLLDAAWILGSSNVVTRLRGVDDQEYALSMTASAARDGGKELNVWFQLREAGAVASVNIRPLGANAADKQITDLALSLARLEKEIETLRQKNTENYPDVVKARSELAAVEKQLVEAEAQRGVGRGSSNGVSQGVGQGVGRGVGAVVAGAAPRASNSIIGTSFTMDPGETVVVGTSRLRGGDKALIALLTAVPRGKAAPKD